MCRKQKHFLKTASRPLKAGLAGTDTVQDEWKATLKVLQEAGKLTYNAVSDNISLPV